MNSATETAPTANNWTAATDLQTDQGTLRWGILSTAKIASKIRQAIRFAAHNEALAVASRDADRAAEWANAHNVPKSYGNYEALLDDPNIDAIYIALPPSMHHEWTIRAAERGKHVLCEKPLARNLSEAEEMAAACREHRVQLMDGVMWVHHKRTAAMQKYFADDTLGTLRRVTTAFTFNWDQAPSDNIRVRPELGGGCLGDLGWYCVRAIWWAIGSVPDRVFATARHYNGVTYNLSALMWFAGQKMASFDCGFDTGMRQWIEVAGSHRSVVCDDLILPRSNDRARWWVHEGQNEQGGVEEHVVAGCTQEVAMIEHFSQHVLRGEWNLHWVAEALTTQRVCDAIQRSIQRGSPVDLQ